MDWAHHPLGLPARCPTELKTALAMIFQSRQPMCIFWEVSHFCFYNQACIPLLGFDKHPQSQGQKAEEIWSERSEKCPMDQIDLVMSQGVSVLNRQANFLESKNESLSGNYLDFSFSPLFIGKGAIKGVWMMAQSRAVLSLPRAQVGGWSVELSTGELRISAEILDFLGFQAGGQNIFDFLKQVVCTDDINDVTQSFDLCISQGRPIRTEFRALSEDGHLRWMLAIGEIKRDLVHRPQAIDGIVLDIHEQKMVNLELTRAKAVAELANESKSSFLANMSHEIRTPLTAILGFAELLRDEAMCSAERQNSIGRIERSGHALLKLIDNILDLSKIEAGQMTVHRESFSPKELIAEVVALLTPTANNKDLELRTEIGPGLPSRILSDPGCVRQVVLNLIGNAIKFTDQGIVTVKVVMESNRYLKIDVIDSGIGISKESQSRLFQAFSQADDSITKQFGGTGLGLALSRRLCECLGGSLILAESEYGKGSRFVAQIEAVPDLSFQIESAQINGTFHKDDVESSLRGVRILVAEDGVDNKALFRLYLEPTGAELTIVSDGNEAYIKAKNGNYDLILMDLQMPGMDGLQATRQLRKLGYRGPIVALTAHAMKEEVRRSLEAGCNAHINKPISRMHLISAVREHLHNSTRLH